MADLSSPMLDAKYEVAHLTRYFEQSGNVAAAWRCWHLARKWGFPVPAVVDAEIDRFAAAIAGVTDAALAGNAESRLDSKTVARLWGAAARGKEDPAKALCAWDRDLDVAVDVYLKRKKMSAEQAYEAVAEERHMGKENVVRLYKKHRAEIEAGAVEE